MCQFIIQNTILAIALNVPSPSQSMLVIWHILSLKIHRDIVRNKTLFKALQATYWNAKSPPQRIETLARETQENQMASYTYESRSWMLSKQTQAGEKVFLEEMMSILNFERQNQAELLVGSRKVVIPSEEDMDYCQSALRTCCWSLSSSLCSPPSFLQTLNIFS